MQQIGRQLLEGAPPRRHGMPSGRFWSDSLMESSLRDAQFELQLFRFIDRFLTPSGRDDVYSHFVDYLTRPGVALPDNAIESQMLRGMTTISDVPPPRTSACAFASTYPSANLCRAWRTSCAGR